MHLATEQTISFSTHSVAEELCIPREAVLDRFDEVERKLLQDSTASLVTEGINIGYIGTCAI